MLHWMLSLEFTYVVQSVPGSVLDGTGTVLSTITDILIKEHTMNIACIRTSNLRKFIDPVILTHV